MPGQLICWASTQNAKIGIDLPTFFFKHSGTEIGPQQILRRTRCPCSLLLLLQRLGLFDIYVPFIHTSTTLIVPFLLFPCFFVGASTISVWAALHFRQPFCLGLE